MPDSANDRGANSQDTPWRVRRPIPVPRLVLTSLVLTSLVFG